MSKIIGKIIGLLFGLLFAGFGAIFLIQMVFITFGAWYDMKKWQPVEIELISVGSYDNKTTAEYTYLFKNREFIGNRVYPAKFNDNIGPYHRKLQQRLRHHKNKSLPLQGWLNPDNPEESVIDRNIRWGLMLLISLFCSVFLFIGLGVCWAVLFSKTEEKQRGASLTELKLEYQNLPESEKDQSFIDFLQSKRSKRYQQNKEGEESKEDIGQEPWRKRKQWQSATIRSQAKGKLLILWLFTLIWTGACFPMLLAMREELHTGNYVALAILLFPMAALLLLYQVVRKTIEYFRFGKILCHLDPFPGGIGGNVGGGFEIPGLTLRNATFQISLECGFSYVSGSGKSRSRKERILWSETGASRAENRNKNIRVNFVFDIPENLPASSALMRGEYHFWRLSVKAEVPGVDLERSYLIPVYATGEKSRSNFPDLSDQMKENLKEQEKRSKIAMERGDFQAAGLTPPVKVEKIDRGLRIKQSMFRNKLLSFIGLVFGLSFSGATFAMVSQIDRSGIMQVVMIIFSIPFGLVGCIGLIAALYLPLNSLRVTVRRKEITVLRMLFILPIYFKRVQGSEIDKLAIFRSGSMGQGIKKKVYYSIKVHLKGGGKVTLSEGILGEDVANNFRDYLERRVRSGY